MKSAGRLSLAFLLALASHRYALAGECAPRILSPTIATADGATIPKGGGIVVVQSLGDGLAAHGPMSSWRFVDGGRVVALSSRTIAPGLTVLEPIGSRLQTTARGKPRTFTVTSAADLLAAPKVKSVEQTRTHQGYRVTTTVSVVLDKPATAAQFLVVYDKDGKVARSFGTAKAGDTRVDIYTAAECTTLPDGTLVTQAGDAITFAWLDPTGRLSARSAVAIVTAPPEGPPVR